MSGQQRNPVWCSPVLRTPSTYNPEVIDMLSSTTPSSLQIRNLAVLGYANGFTLWHYRVPVGCLADVARMGYFQDIASMLSPGDIILATNAEGARQLFVRDREEDMVVLATS